MQDSSITDNTQDDVAAQSHSASGDPVAQGAAPPHKSRAHNYAMSPIATTSHAKFGVVWLVALGLLAIVWPLFTAGVINEYTATNSNFIDALYQRKDISMREHPATERGRIVIVGGSDALFGIDAAQIERALGVPTINYGTHAGLGASYILDRARRALHPGDTVVLTLAYGMWGPREQQFSDVEFAYFTSYDKQYYLQLKPHAAVSALYSIPLQNYWGSLERLVRYWRNKHLRLAPMYDVAHLDENGDINVVMPGRLNYFLSPGVPMPDKLPDRTARALREFSSWAHENHIRLYYSWPNYSRPLSQVNAPVLPSPALVQLFSQCGIEVLDSPSDNFYPPDWFFDTDKHLNSSGRRIRTQALIAHLAPLFGKSPDDLEKAPLYVLAGPNAGLEPADLLPDGPLRFVYINQQPTDHPYDVHGSITPDQLAAQVKSGRVAYYADRRADVPLRSVGLVGQTVLKDQQSLAQWLAPWQNHLFLCMRPDDPAWDPGDLAGIPSGLAQLLAGPKRFATIFGTGRYASVSRSLKVGRPYQFDLGKLVGSNVPPMQISVYTSAANPPVEWKQNLLVVNGREIAPAEQGLRIVVIDPHYSRIVAAAVFESPEATVTTEARYRIVPSTASPLKWSSVDVHTLSLAGLYPPFTEQTAEGLVFQSRGLAGYRSSVVGIDMGIYLSQSRAAVVRFTVQGPADTLFRTAVSTNIPQMFSYLPEPLMIHCTGQPQTVELELELAPGTRLSAADKVIAGLAAEIGHDRILIQSAQAATITPLN